MELENLYTIIDEVISILPRNLKKIFVEYIQDDLNTCYYAQDFILNLKNYITMYNVAEDIGDNEFSYLMNMIDSLDVKQLDIEIDLIQRCNDIITDYIQKEKEEKRKEGKIIKKKNNKKDVDF